MTTFAKSMTLVAALTLLAGCATSGKSAGSADREASQSDLAPISSGSATIFSAGLLHRANRSLLDLLQQHLTNMQVVSGSPCPEVYLRGKSNITTPSDPAIYVNHQRAANTCILTALETYNLERVEVYPSGIPRGAYLANPYGVIVITMAATNP